jgi:hypothetical protein
MAGTTEGWSMLVGKGLLVDLGVVSNHTWLGDRSLLVVSS